MADLSNVTGVAELLGNDTEPEKGNLWDDLDKELEGESNPFFMFAAIVAMFLWAMYITYYNTRVLGIIVTAITNRFIKFGHIRFGKSTVVTHWL